MRHIKGLVTGRSQTWHLESEELATSCGFQEMPGYTMRSQEMELSNTELPTQPIVLETTSSLAVDTSSLASDIVSTSSS